MVKLDVMEQNETIRKLLPPRVIDAITSGVNKIEKRPYLLLFPILLDLFFWLGPNLSITEPVTRLYSQFLTEVQQVYASYDIPTVEIQALTDLQSPLTEYLTGYDLISVAKTFPIGIPGLLANVDTSLSPLGPSQTIALTNFSTILLALILLAFIGVVLGTLYFHLAASAMQQTANSSKNLFQQFTNSLIYSILLLSIASAGVLASIFIATFFAIIVPLLGQFVMVLLMMTVFLLLLPALYAFIPIFLYEQSFYQAIMTSYKVVGLHMRYKLNAEQTIIISPRVLTFSMSILILYQGMNILWLRLPAIDSWWMLVGIVGHAFISTLVLVSCFDFFQKMCDWHRRLTQSEVC
jgi:hypothetical protein